MKTYTAREVRVLLSHECAEAGGVQKWAKSKGVGEHATRSVITGAKMFGGKFERALGLKRVWVLDDKENVS